jgi:uncharacterized protein YyaL (SSP411 family)
MPNRLAQETSPYLLQHADNPVDWYPWGDEALQLAQEQDKPILLSIGYAACHWCHVMAHESFEDEETAVYMNEHFVNIKVDREERPDLDSIYMNAVVAMTGQGGWPMTVFLTPEGRPFFGGTYFPPVPRYNMPSFQQVLASINRAWHEQRADIDENAVKLADGLARIITQGDQEDVLDETLFDNALAGLLRAFDEDLGGFGNAPKFPPSMTLEFLLRIAQRRGDQMAGHMAEHTLKMMAQGGMYDQLGGGFSRYSTDSKWLVPHFEKMLYDNALLARVYLHAYQVTGDNFYRRVAAETLDFVLRELRHEQGGFYSSYDADSEGEEGKFYVWHPEEIKDVLGEDAEPFMLYYDVSEHGNWEGKNILHVPRAPEEVADMLNMEVDELKARLVSSRQKLYAVRAQRVWPGLDDKVLTSWNGLMLAAFAEAARIMPRPDYIDAAQANAEFLYQHMRQENGRLLRTWKAGAKAKYNAYLEDYAYLADGLLALYQTTFNEKWFIWAQELADIMLEHFKDPDGIGFFDTSDDHENLIQRPKDMQDNAVPSGNAMAAQVLLKLSLYTGNGRYWDVADVAVRGMISRMSQFPTGFAHWLCAADFILSEPQELAIAGIFGKSGTMALLDVAQNRYRPNLVTAVGPNGDVVPLLAERPQIEGKATAYVCRRFVCQQPVTDPNKLALQL